MWISCELPVDPESEVEGSRGKRVARWLAEKDFCKGEPQMGLVQGEEVATWRGERHTSRALLDGREGMSPTSISSWSMAGWRGEGGATHNHTHTHLYTHTQQTSSFAKCECQGYRTLARTIEEEIV